MDNKITDVTDFLEEIAPLSYQEKYDNAGLITGDPNWKVSGVLTCLDVTDEILQEAKSKGCNLIVSHHPIIFRALKKLNVNYYVDRVIIKAIKEDIAIYAIHTNLDNVLVNGVNETIANRLGLINQKYYWLRTTRKKVLVQVYWRRLSSHLSVRICSNWSKTNYKPNQFGIQWTLGDPSIRLLYAVALDLFLLANRSDRKPMY